MREKNFWVVLVLSVLMCFAAAATTLAEEGTAKSTSMGMRAQMMGAGSESVRGGMGMGMVKEMGCMEMMQQDPKLMGRMMELRGEMMREMGEAMVKRGKEMQKSSKGSSAPANPQQ